MDLFTIFTLQMWMSTQDPFLNSDDLLSHPGSKAQFLGPKHYTSFTYQTKPFQNTSPSMCQQQPWGYKALLMNHLSFMERCITQDKNTSLQLISHLNLHLKHENGCQLLTPRNEMLCSALHTPPWMSHLVKCFLQEPQFLQWKFPTWYTTTIWHSSGIYLLLSLYNLQMTLTSEKIFLPTQVTNWLLKKKQEFSSRALHGLTGGVLHKEALIIK